MMKSTVSFDDLSYDKFRRLADDDSLSRHEKVGFPDEYREAKELEIFNDVVAKLSGLSKCGMTILEIGPGCSALPIMLVDRATNQQSTVHFVDSPEMLRHLPDGPAIVKHAGRFPDEVRREFEAMRREFDCILAYSVLQYAFAEASIFDFVDSCVDLLKPGGEILLGDIPNATMRKRFLASDSGRHFHRTYTGRDEDPVVAFNSPDIGQMDDSVVIAIMSRARAQGCHAWVVPQSAALPMSNRREDILIRKP